MKFAKATKFHRKSGEPGFLPRSTGYRAFARLQHTAISSARATMMVPAAMVLSAF